MAIRIFVILIAAAELFTISVGCRDELSSQRKGREMDRRLKEPWAETECRVMMNGEKVPTSVTGRRAIYDVELKPNQYHSTVVTSFIDPRTGRSWLGPEADYYLQTDAGVQGIKLDHGSLRWFDSLVKEPKAKQGMSAKIDDVVVEFDQNVSNDQLLEEGWARGGHLLKNEGAPDAKQPRRTHLEESIDNHDFFTASPMSSQLGEPKIVAIGIDEGLLKIDMTSQTGVYKASVWIDVKTRKATKAVFDEFKMPVPKLPPGLAPK